MWKLTIIALSMGWFACDYFEVGNRRPSWPAPGSRIAPDDIRLTSYPRTVPSREITIRRFTVVDIDEAVRKDLNPGTGQPPESR